MHVLLETRNLWKEYGSGKGVTVALRDVSIQVYEGEMLVILGSSGSGKSTLLHLLGGMDSASKGNIYYNSQDISHLSTSERARYRCRHIGFVFQFYNLIADLTVKENVELAAALVKHPMAAETALEMVGLKNKLNDYPAELSGGEQQRVSIARALAKQTGLMLFDEPTGALEYESGKRILSIMELLVHEYKQTVIMVTHTQAIADMADRVIRMRNGQIIDIKKNPSPISADEVNW